MQSGIVVNNMMKIFLVGGAVRDKLLNYPVYEQDWVVIGATPDMMKVQGFEQVGKDFPVFLHPTTKDEYALARTERKTAPGYTGFAFHADETVTLEEDLKRRDLTINAIAETKEGELIDPYNGQADIKNRLLRHVSEAFCEDPVRILRIARFAARYHHLGFRIASETQALMQSMVNNGEVDALVSERIWKETSRALSETTPHIFFTVLRECGALARIMPELDVLFGVPQPEKHHPEIDTGIHSLMALEQASQMSADIAVRFAALIHDLGKADTPKASWPSHHGHEKSGLPHITRLCQRMGSPNAFKRLAKVVCEFHTHCHRALELNPKTINNLFMVLGAYKNTDIFEQFLLCCEADAKGRTGFESRDYPQAAYLRQALKSCDGVTAAPFIAQGLIGPDIGEAISRARTQRIAQFKKDIANS